MIDPLTFEQIEAERVTHSNETLAQVNARLAHERVDSPAQTLLRKRRKTPEQLQIRRLAGISYRQLDYWTSQRLIKADDNSPGSGIARSWPLREQEIAVLIRRLTEAGLGLRQSAVIARKAVESATTSVEIGDGIWLDIDLSKGKKK